MLNNLFLQIIDMSITSAMVIIGVLVIRKFLKLAPKVYSYLLWSIVLIKLLVPLSIESDFSILPRPDVLREQLTSMAEIDSRENDESYSEDIDVNNGLNTNITLSSELDNYNTNTNNNNFNISNNDIKNNESITHRDNSANEEIQNFTVSNVSTVKSQIKILALTWILGLVVLLSKNIYDLQKLKATLLSAELYKDNIYFSNSINTAFVLGVFKPKIYLPKGLSNEEIEYIVLHEQIHLKRKDNILRLLSFIALCVHWFNPLVWLAYKVSEKDMEMSCDENVVEILGKEIKGEYSTSLLALATSQNKIKPVALAFAENDTKGRVKNILSYKKPKFWLIVVSTVVLFVTFTTFFTTQRD